MAVLFTIVALIVMIGVIYRIYLPSLVKWLAEANILYTTVEEGQAKAIMCGEDFERFVMSYDGYHLNHESLPGHDPSQPDWEVLPDDPSAPKGFYDPRTEFQKRYGLYWIGWPWDNNKVYTYTFRWNETKTEAEGEDRGSEKIQPREAETDFVYVKDFIYVAVTTGAETKEGLPTREQTNITVRITNPYKALFRTDGWMRRVMSPTNRIAREYVASKSYKDLLAATEADTKTSYTDQLIDLTGKLPEDEDDADEKGLSGKCGVTITAADLETIELTGSHKSEYQSAAGAAFTAEQTAIANVTAAMAEASQIQLIGDAEAGVIRAKGSAEAEALKARAEVAQQSPEAMELARFDGLVEASKGNGTNTIWAHDPFRGLARALKGK